MTSSSQVDRTFAAIAALAGIDAVNGFSLPKKKSMGPKNPPPKICVPDHPIVLKDLHLHPNAWLCPISDERITIHSSKVDPHSTPCSFEMSDLPSNLYSPETSNFISNVVKHIILADLVIFGGFIRDAILGNKFTDIDVLCGSSVRHNNNAKSILRGFSDFCGSNGYRYELLSGNADYETVFSAYEIIKTRIVFFQDARGDPEGSITHIVNIDLVFSRDILNGKPDFDVNQLFLTRRMNHDNSKKQQGRCYVRWASEISSEENQYSLVKLFPGREEIICCLGSMQCYRHLDEVKLKKIYGKNIPSDVWKQNSRFVKTKNIPRLVRTLRNIYSGSLVANVVHRHCFYKHKNDRVLFDELVERGKKLEGKGVKISMKTSCNNSNCLFNQIFSQIFSLCSKSDSQQISLRSRLN